MRILVTGAAGFIGSGFIRNALKAGHHIGGLIRPGGTIRPARPAQAGDLVWLEGTLEDAPWKEIDAFEPEVCVHLAWVVAPNIYLESPENEKHLRWGLKFIRRARQAGVRHVVGMGSCIEYRIGPEPLSEERTPLRPQSLYARCKNALREELEADARREDFLFCWGRLFYAYGPGEHPERLCSTLIEKLARDERITLKTPRSLKDYIYIDDAASAILISVEKRIAGAINWGTGAGVTVKEIADTIAETMQKQDLVEEADPLLPDPYPCVVADATKLKSAGWAPKVSLENGIRRLIEERLS